MDAKRAQANPEEYARWINRRLGAEVRRRREALRLSAYALAKRARVTDQTILNLEQGLHSPTATTLALVAACFGTTCSELVMAAEMGRWRDAG